MWLMLALAVVVCVAVLYVPGYLFARSLFVSRFASVAIAPMISIFFLAVLGIVLFEVGVTCSGPVLLAIAVAIGAIALLGNKGDADHDRYKNGKRYLARKPGGSVGERKKSLRYG